MHNRKQTRLSWYLIGRSSKAELVAQLKLHLVQSFDKMQLLQLEDISDMEAVLLCPQTQAVNCVARAQGSYNVARLQPYLKLKAFFYFENQIKHRLCLNI